MACNFGKFSYCALSNLGETIQMKSVAWGDEDITEEEHGPAWSVKEYLDMSL